MKQVTRHESTVDNKSHAHGTATEPFYIRKQNLDFFKIERNTARTSSVESIDVPVCLSHARIIRSVTLDKARR
jgi:hypothetical protein